MLARCATLCKSADAAHASMPCSTSVVNSAASKNRSWKCAKEVSVARSLEDLLSDQSMAFFVIDSRNFSHAVFTSVGASHDQPPWGGLTAGYYRLYEKDAVGYVVASATAPSNE